MATTQHPTPSVSAYPYAVGRMVYPSMADALAAIERARELYPEHPFQVIDRATGYDAESDSLQWETLPDSGEGCARLVLASTPARFTSKLAGALVPGDVLVIGVNRFTVTGTSRAAASTEDRIAVFGKRFPSGDRVRGAWFFDRAERVTVAAR